MAGQIYQLYSNVHFASCSRRFRKVSSAIVSASGQFQKQTSFVMFWTACSGCASAKSYCVFFKASNGSVKPQLLLIYFLVSLFERQSSSQKTIYPFDPITESQFESEEGIGAVLQCIANGRPVTPDDDRTAYTLADSPEVFEWSDIPSVNAWHSDYDDFSSDNHHSLPPVPDASMTYHVEVEDNAQLLGTISNNQHNREDSSMPSAETASKLQQEDNQTLCSVDSTDNMSV